MKTLKSIIAISFLLFLNMLMFGQKPFGLGANFDPNVYSKGDLADFTSLGFSDDIPSAYSLKQFAPIPKNQGLYGNCTGWASTYGGLTIAFAKKFGITDKYKNTALAFDPFFTYNQIKNPDDVNCERGSQIYNALANFRIHGAKRFYLPEFDCGVPVDEITLANAKEYKIKSFKRLFEFPEDMDYDNWPKSLFETKIDKATNVKRALGNGYTVIVATYLTESFFGLYGTDFYSPTAEERLDLVKATSDKDGNPYGHAMCIVGYDDNKYGGAFEVMNSWGTEWGDQGFFWIKYEDLDLLAFNTWYFELFDDYVGSTGCLYGDCEDGYGTYKFENGDMYDGQFKDGKKNGYGVYVWSDGAAYAGNWNMDLRCGYAASLTPGNPVARGYWEEDVPVDYEVNCQATTTGCIEGDCENGIGTYKYDNGTYHGTFKEGFRDGFGRYVFNSGMIYECTWSMGSQNGFGRITFTDGNHYIGEFSNGKLHGIGMVYFNSGYYSGRWENGNYVTTETSGPKSGSVKMDHSNAIGNTSAPANNCINGNCEDGYGTMVYDNGTYTGYFKNGKRHGYGEYTFDNGLKYIGNWESDNQDGIGKYIFADGGYYIGEMRRGLQDGYGLEAYQGNFGPGVWELGEYQEGEYKLGFSGDEKVETISSNDLDMPTKNLKGMKLRIQMAARSTSTK
jgi:hypothetical protein